MRHVLAALLLTLATAVATTFGGRGADAQDLSPFVLLGNPEGDVTVVEFLDYQCPGCKAIHPALEQLLHSDPGIRLEARPLALLGPESALAARAVLAAAGHPGQANLHGLLLTSTGLLTEQRVMDAATVSGMDAALLRRAMEAPGLEPALDSSLDRAMGYHMQGTPAFLIGYAFLNGPTLEEITAAIARVRAGRPR